MGASAAGAVILLKEKQIVAAFRQAGATSAPAAGHTSRFGRARAPGISQVAWHFAGYANERCCAKLGLVSTTSTS